MEASSDRTFYEFFAGGGGARLGLGAGWDCTFANDNKYEKARPFAVNFGREELVVGDVAKLTVTNLPGRADLAWCSHPCKDTSVAGDRAGLGGARSRTFRSFWKPCRPSASRIALRG